MIRLTAERESAMVQIIQIRTTWQSEQWADAWAVLVSDHLAVNRADGWTITHRQTGLAAGSASTMKDAVGWPDRLLRSRGGLSWKVRERQYRALTRRA
jgi:hypothetical protein